MTTATADQRRVGPMPSTTHEVICGDAAEVLPSLGIKPDLILTSPPYGQPAGVTAGMASTSTRCSRCVSVGVMKARQRARVEYRRYRPCQMETKLDRRFTTRAKFSTSKRLV